MTLGEKIKDARKRAGLTQDQLADKLMVSRQAITKWEGDRGIPDIENLKGLSAMLNVSIDYLLEDSCDLDMSVIREPIDLAHYQGRLKSKKKNAVIRGKYPDAEIHILVAYENLKKGEKIVDTALWLITPLAPGTLDVAKSIDNLDNSFYLVEENDEQYLVLITSDFIESRKLSRKFVPNKFKKIEIGNYRFKDGGKIK